MITIYESMYVSTISATTTPATTTTITTTIATTTTTTNLEPQGASLPNSGELCGLVVGKS